MREEVRRYWNERHATGDAPGGGEPALFLVEHEHLLPREGRALDVAMGSGRNALYLASLGLQVTGIDISEVAVQQAREESARRGLAIEAIEGDVSSHDLGQEQYDLIINFYFLDRGLASRLVEALKPGGLLVFETYTLAQLSLEGGPSNPQWLLQPAELPLMFRGLKKLYYRDEVIEERGRKKAVASLIARKPGG
ncbi:MAG TPA: class I SAM-dependent methyltransferase [Dehalococcoidia bacterium]|nr:class I SAM-dependent methyltransferase [Dehalococcoidia bacterium]